MWKELGIAARALMLGLVGIFVLGILIASMQIFGWGAFQRSTADFRGQTDVIEAVSADAGYRMDNYEWFYNQCHAVRNTEASMKALRNELETANPSDYRVQQIHTNLTALESKRAEQINTYNSRASMNETRANFQASDLPDVLDIAQEVTECHFTDE